MKNDLKDIVQRVEKLEKAIFGSNPKKTYELKINPKRDSLPDRILGLRNAGFFKQPKTSQEVHAELQSTYPCDFNRVEVALLRLLKRKFLRITSKNINNKKLKSYVW